MPPRRSHRSLGRQAGRFAAAIAAVQAILGDHQDTVMAGAWLRATGAAVSQACIAAGELIAAERQEWARLRSRWPKVWRALESALAVPGLVRMVAGRTSRSLRGNDVPGVENETWTYEQAHAWYRHRFYRFEPDLDTDNPAVREEIRKVALFWVGLGVTGFRIDKVLSQAGDVLTGPHGEASEENPGSVGPRPRVSRVAGRPGLHLHELPDLLMWPRGRAASLAL